MEIIKDILIPLTNANKELADPDLLLFYYGMQDRDIWLDDEIGWDSVSTIIKYIHFLNRHSDDKETPITLHIFSNGGEIDAMWALITTIEESEIPVYTVNEGNAHSAAFQVFLSGKKRFMKKNAYSIAHEGSASMGGNYRETKQAMIYYEKEVERTCQYIVAHSNLKYEYIKNKFDQSSDWYIDYEEALAAEIITN